LRVYSHFPELYSGEVGTSQETSGLNPGRLEVLTYALSMSSKHLILDVMGSDHNFDCYFIRFIPIFPALYSGEPVTFQGASYLAPG
jgi:hypothetical protein